MWLKSMYNSYAYKRFGWGFVLRSILLLLAYFIILNTSNELLVGGTPMVNCYKRVVNTRICSERYKNRKLKIGGKVHVKEGKKKKQKHKYGYPSMS